jgi:hypothetical protein
LRERMAGAGYARVRSQFSMERGIAELEYRFRR